MTVSSENYRNQYEGNGVTTTFAYAYKILTDADLLVIKTGTTGTETTLVLDTHYSVTDAGEATGSISYPLTGTKLAADEYITLTRHMDITQTTDLNNQGGFYPDTVEGMVDKNLMLIQQVQEEIDRCPKLTEGTTEDSGSYLTVIQAAETACETAETNAETAETNAETAKTNAETAETNAAASAVAAAASAAGVNLPAIAGGDKGKILRVNVAETGYELKSLIGKNILINGGFTVNQRVYVSAAALATTVYGHDRWKAGASGGDYSFTQLNSNTLITIASGKTLIQVVENKNVVGGTYTLSWEGTAQGRYAVNSDTPSGSYADSPIAITGQTAGTVMSVEFDDGTLGKVQLEEGTTATDFEYRQIGDELALCQRYYEKSYNLDVVPGAVTNIGEVLKVSGNITFLPGVYFMVNKRSNPTFTIYSYLGTAGKVSDIGNVNTGTTITFAGVGQKAILALQDSGSGFTLGLSFYYQWTASAEL